MKDWKGNYYEVINKEEGIIEVGVGNLKNMSSLTQKYIKGGAKPDKEIEVNKKKFLVAVRQFAKKHEGTKYHLLDFSDNCMGFKKYVLGRAC